MWSGWSKHVNATDNTTTHNAHHSHQLTGYRIEAYCSSLYYQRVAFYVYKCYVKVKVGCAVSLVQAVGGGASTPDHVQSHTYINTRWWVFHTSQLHSKEDKSRQLNEVGNTRTVVGHRHTDWRTNCS